MTHPLSGSLLGTAAGDAYGLPYEGLSTRRIGKLFVPCRYVLIPLLHGGMVSDDTEHAVMAAVVSVSPPWRIRLSKPSAGRSR